MRTTWQMLRYCFILKGDNEEELRNLKAHTYNLENGKVIETKVDVKNSVYRTSLE